MRKHILFVLVFFMGSFYLFGQQTGFTAVYDQMHLKFSGSYPFGKWKAVDWNALNSRIRPKIADAEAVNDTIAFYLAVKEYVTTINDGHVSLKGWNNRKETAKYRQIGGSYGFTVVKLDDGRIVARLVNPGTPAYLAGMVFGAEIVEVNDQPVRAALDTVPILWAELNPATHECKLLNQCRFIGRAPVGKTMKIKFLNRGTTDPVTVTLTAVDDGYATYDQTTMTPLDQGPAITSKILTPGGYGYIKLTSEYGQDSSIVKQIYLDFRNAITNFNAQGVPGLILDMRVNLGGEDALSAAFSGFFYSDTTLYEYMTWYDPDSDSLKIWPYLVNHYNPVTLQAYTNPKYPVGSLFIEPQGFNFSKPVMVLVSPRSVSSGEGIPMALQKLPRCKVVGFNGTNGSFGLVEYRANLYPSPDELYVRYPFGQSLDKNFKTQLDSDSNWVGGVIPDIRVPLTDSVIDQLYIDSTDVELNYAIRELNSMLGINELGPGGSDLMLEQLFPNPVHSSATISYYLENAGIVSLSVFDLCGKLVKTLVDGSQKAGHHSVVWNVENIQPGVYFYRICTNKRTITKKCIVQ
ncbi:MAG: S41 family peptidase [Bacteroidales bacterium]|nr:S41 family peptidase [Bacteroidales bacterium]